MSRKRPCKFIFFTGGVVSSLGKGLTAASTAAILESSGLRVTMLKMDPYINVDPGTMSPYQHGEVFVTDDGAETDLDLGHYERFVSESMGKRNNFTTGQVYEAVIQKERAGEYLGSTVQVIPHVTDEIKRRILGVADDFDCVIVEVGGTVGDIEGLPFLEAIRQLRHDLGSEHTLFVHLTLVPYIPAAGEIKTKPTQHSVAALREIGIQPDLIVCRTDRPLEADVRRKISLFCNVKPECVIAAQDVSFIYELPMRLHEEGIDERICERLNIWARKPDLKPWEDFVSGFKNASREVSIGMVGKYTGLVESYKSLSEALVHAGVANRCRVNIKYIDAETLESLRDDRTAALESLGDDGAAALAAADSRGDDRAAALAALSGIDGLVIPGGFGARGVEGKIKAIRAARENGIPFLGLCLGMQLAVVEYARNVLKLDRANSTEFDPGTPYPVIDLLPDQLKRKGMGASMRLGAYSCALREGSMLRSIYGAPVISERHRHRYEVNPQLAEKLENGGLTLSGVNPDTGLVEMIELAGHPHFVGTQAHPEFKSRPLAPGPLFVSFIRSALEAGARATK